VKKKTYRTLSCIPLFGPIFKIVCDPMLFSTPASADGLPKQVTEYMRDHPDTFVTKRLLWRIMSNKK